MRRDPRPESDGIKSTARWFIVVVCLYDARPETGWLNGRWHGSKRSSFLDDAYTLARYLLRDEHDAQDVVQDAVLRALRYFDSFTDGDSRAWFLAIVRNCCYTWRKSRHGPRALVDNPHERLMTVADPRAADELALATSEQERIRLALESLPRELAEVIVLRELSDLSYREISEVVGIPMGTVMSRLSRARSRLADVLGPRSQEAS